MKPNSFLRNVFVFMISFSILFGCSNKKSKTKFFVSGVVCKNLTVEKYIVGYVGGTFCRNIFRLLNRLH